MWGGSCCPYSHKRYTCIKSVLSRLLCTDAWDQDVVRRRRATRLLVTTSPSARYLQLQHRRCLAASLLRVLFSSVPACACAVDQHLDVVAAVFSDLQGHLQRRRVRLLRSPVRQRVSRRRRFFVLAVVLVLVLVLFLVRVGWGVGCGVSNVTDACCAIVRFPDPLGTPYCQTQRFARPPPPPGLRTSRSHRAARGRAWKSCRRRGSRRRNRYRYRRRLAERHVTPPPPVQPC